MLQQARSTLRRLEGIEGQPEPEETRTSKPSQPQLRSEPTASELSVRPRASPAESPEMTPGGRLLTTQQRRREMQPVPLKVEKLHAPKIWEEWTGSGKLTVQENVTARKWSNVDAKKGAFDLARAVDVMDASGLDVKTEPAAEVMLRAIAATWFADRHSGEKETAEWLKESSMSHFGVPRELLEDARTLRKLLVKAVGGEEER